MHVKVTYRERLLPKWWVFVFVLSIIGMLSIAYGAAISAPVGWLMFLVLATLISIAMFTSSPIIEVSDSLRVESAHLPFSSIASVHTLDATQTREARRSPVDATRFVTVKTWAAADAVLVILDDPADPHPAWLVSSRHPEQLMAAINASTHAGGSTPS